jgi:hypothetical protein
MNSLTDMRRAIEEFPKRIHGNQPPLPWISASQDSGAGANRDVTDVTSLELFTKENVVEGDWV